MLKRIEVNIADGVRTEVPQQAYRNGEDVLVLDAFEDYPNGYEPFTPGQDSGEPSIDN